MSKPVCTIGNVRDDIPPRCAWTTDAVLTFIAGCASMLALGCCAWAHWGM